MITQTGFIVSEGERDFRILPRLVNKLMGDERNFVTKPWKHFVTHARKPSRRPASRGRDIGRKLELAIAEANRRGFDCVIAVTDFDKPELSKYKALKAAREKSRSNSSLTPLPTAIGEPKPHIEAWLLDDEKAVRTVLKLQPTDEIPHPVKCGSPKAELNRLYDSSGRSDADKLLYLEELAAEFDKARCRQGKHTGFNAFCDDLESEAEKYSR